MFSVSDTDRNVDRLALASKILNAFCEELHIPFFVGGGYALAEYLNFPSTFQSGDMDIFIPLPNSRTKDETEIDIVKGINDSFRECTLWRGEVDGLPLSLAHIQGCVTIACNSVCASEVIIKRRSFHDSSGELYYKSYEEKKYIAESNATPPSHTPGTSVIECMQFRVRPHDLSFKLDVIAFYVSPMDYISKTPSELYRDYLRSFDLDICQIGFSVNDNVIGKPIHKCDTASVNRAAGIEAMIGVCLRKNVPRDMRKLICAQVAKLDWSHVKTWHFADTWNRAAVERPAEVPAIMHWERSSTKYNPQFGSFEETAGLERIQKYTERGFLIAECPARTHVIQRLMIERARGIAKKLAKKTVLAKQIDSEMAQLTQQRNEWKRVK